MSSADEKNNDDLAELFSKDDSESTDDLGELNPATDDSNASTEFPFNFDKNEASGGAALDGVSDSSTGVDLGTGFDFAVGNDKSAEFEGVSKFYDVDDAAIPTEGDVDLTDPTPADDANGKKNRKGKKVPKAKKERVKKEKIAKEKSVTVRFGSPVPFFVLGAFFLLIVAAGIIAAFATAGAGAVGFLIWFVLLSVVLLSVPTMLLWQQTKQRVGLFDVALALVVACLAIGCMAILAFQAKTYGNSSKVARNVPAIERTFDRC